MQPESTLEERRLQFRAIRELTAESLQEEQEIFRSAEIAAIEMNIYSPEEIRGGTVIDNETGELREIRGISVAPIVKPVVEPLIGSVNDPRMGVVGSNLDCSTCHRDEANCHGHFGHIELAEMFYNQLPVRLVPYILNSVCGCGLLLFSEAQLQRSNVMRYAYDRRMRRISELALSSERKCRREEVIAELQARVVQAQALNNQLQLLLAACPAVPLATPPTLGAQIENVRLQIRRVQLNYEERTRLERLQATKCNSIRKYRSHKNPDSKHTSVQWRLSDRDPWVEIHAQEAYDIMNLISPADSRLLGFSGQGHPRRMIMKALLVVPPRIRRPLVINGVRTEQDFLTETYKKIVKNNNELLSLSSPAAARASSYEAEREKKRNNIYRYLAELIDNRESGNTKAAKRRGLNQLISGKKGAIRQNLMAKRGRHTARSVITIDVAVPLGWASVPRYIARTITIPVTVHGYNYADALRWIQEGRVQYITSETERAGKRIKQRRNVTANVRSKYLDGRLVLKDGDRIERELMDGDTIVLGRAPTLHRGSLMGFRAYIRDQYAIGVHPSVLESYHGDFDGDEMVAFFPQSQESITDVTHVMNVMNCLMDPGTNRPNIVAIQDMLIGAQMMTTYRAPSGPQLPGSAPKQYMNWVDQDLFEAAVQELVETDIDDSFFARIRDAGHIRETPQPDGSVLREYSGAALFSLLLPPGLYYERRSERGDLQVLITDGVLNVGSIGAKDIGKGDNNLLQHLYRLPGGIGAEAYARFITNVTYLTNWYLYAVEIYTIGLGACLDLKLTDEERESEVEKMRLEIEALGERPDNPVEQERYDQAVLGKLHSLRYLGETYTTRAQQRDPDNPLVVATLAGAKAKAASIAQMGSMMGPQTVEGRIVKPSTCPEDREFCFITPGDRSLEASGMVTDTLLGGLSPQAKFIHARSARIPMVNIANETSKTGYLQRRLVKALENSIVRTDHTVRNPSGVIIDYTVEDTGLHSEELTRIRRPDGDLAFFVDVGQLIATVNDEFGM